MLKTEAAFSRYDHKDKLFFTLPVVVKEVTLGGSAEWPLDGALLEPYSLS